jgi:ubiquinone/menaquinone biosynthesis C-methylase UbiE
MSSVGEIYQHGHHTSVVNSHAKRTAETDAAFFLPYLKPGMRLLDAGCGPGSITVGLALRVEPAHAVGIDASESVIETARSLAKAQPARRLTFEVGNIYEPRFPAENFDAIFAHQVLQHLRRPVDALRQFRALLTFGGIVGDISTQRVLAGSTRHRGRIRSQNDCPLEKMESSDTRSGARSKSMTASQERAS